MKTLAIFRKTLRDSRAPTIGIGLVVGGIALMDVLIYPSYKDSLADMEMPEFLQGFLGEATSMASPEGFLTTEFFSWVPILLITLAIIGGSAAFAGEEASGTLDLLLSQPLSRRRLVLEKATALVGAITLASAAGLVGYLLALIRVDMGIPVARFLGALVTMLPLAWLFLMLSLLGSALLPTRGAAALPVTGFTVITYFIQLLALSVPSLQSVQKISPFYWTEGSRVLIHGVDWMRISVFVAIDLLLLGLTLVAFERRDISAGEREWSFLSLLGKHRLQTASPESIA